MLGQVDQTDMNNLGNLAKKTGPTWSREFDLLIRSIGECKSKAEEDAIIAREVDLLKPRLKDAKIDKRSLKEVLVRLTYVEMLGHDASWGHVKALQACSDTNLLTKKVKSNIVCPKHPVGHPCIVLERSDWACVHSFHNTSQACNLMCRLPILLPDFSSISGVT